MDRNQTIGLILIFIILVWTWNMQSLEPPIEEDTTQELVAEPSEIGGTEQKSQVTNPVPQTDSLASAALLGQYGVFSTAASGEVELSTIENDKLKITFSSKGGKIVKAELKEHLKIRKNKEGVEETSQVTLMDNERNKFEYLLNLNNKTISSEDLYFTSDKTGNQVTFTATTSNGGSFQQIYDLGEGYDLSYQIKFNGLQNDLSRTEASVKMNWINVLNAIEQNEMWPSRYSSVYFKEKDDDSDYQPLN